MVMRGKSKTQTTHERDPSSGIIGIGWKDLDDQFRFWSFATFLKILNISISENIEKWVLNSKIFVPESIEFIYVFHQILIQIRGIKERAAKSYSQKVTFLVGVRRQVKTRLFFVIWSCWDTDSYIQGQLEPSYVNDVCLRYNRTN